MNNPIKRRLKAEALKRTAEFYLGGKHFSWWVLFYTSLAIIAISWLPVGIDELIKKQWSTASYKLTASLIILIFFGLSLKRAVRLAGKIEVKSEAPAPSKVLVIFLSPLQRKIKPPELEKTIESGVMKEEILFESEWEMPMIAVKYHLLNGRLRKLYVLTSRQTSQLMPIFKEAFRILYPSISIEEFKPGGIEFQDIKEVFYSVETLYNQLRKEGYRDEDIMVDITGGQTTNSVAAAIATLSVGRRFQYVSTRDKEVLSYDIGYFEA